jgi:hypothetical protein
MAEYTPELSKAVLDAIYRKIQEDEARKVAEARGLAVTRGLGTGSTFESGLIGDAGRGATQAKTDAMVQLAIENAARQREERLLADDRAYRSAEAEKDRAARSQEAASQREFGVEQGRLDREANEEIARDQAKNNLLMAGGQLGGSLLTGLFRGRGGAPAAMPGGAGSLLNLAPGGVGSTLTGGAPGAMGAIGLGKLALGAGAMAASAGISSGAGQLLGKGLFKSNRARTGARKGAQIGGIAGTALGMPLIGGMGGAVIGGAGKKIKKLFCFDPETLVELPNGDTLAIGEIWPGMEIKGGTVESIRYAVTDDGTVYDYSGVIVTGSHAVNEDGKWLRVETSAKAVPVPGKRLVVSLVTTEHRIYINGITFADEHETDLYEQLSLEDSLKRLNLLEQAVK